MPFDNRPDPSTLFLLISKPGLEYPENANFWHDIEQAYGAFDPCPAPWLAWEALGIGENPELPLELDGDDTVSSIYGYRKRWEEQDAPLSLRYCFNRIVYGLLPSTQVSYTVLGGSLAIPGGAAQTFLKNVPGNPAVSDFEAMRRSIIAHEYGAAAFEEGDTQRGRVIDPRLRDWASRETNIRITNEAAETLVMGRDYVMTWAGQALYPEQTAAMRTLTAQEGLTLNCNLIAGTRDIRKTLKEAYEHGRKTGEWMHPRQIAATVQAFAKNFAKTAEAADTVELWNTDEDRPILIARKTAKDRPLEILDSWRYIQFQEQQYFNPQGRKLTEISPRLALYELFGPKPSPAAV